MFGGNGFNMMGLGLVDWLLNLFVIGIFVYTAVKLALKNKLYTLRLLKTNLFSTFQKKDWLPLILF